MCFPFSSETYSHSWIKSPDLSNLISLFSRTASSEQRQCLSRQFHNNHIWFHPTALAANSSFPLDAGLDHPGSFDKAAIQSRKCVGQEINLTEAKITCCISKHQALTRCTAHIYVSLQKQSLSLYDLSGWTSFAAHWLQHWKLFYLQTKNSHVPWFLTDWGENFT